MNTDRFITLLAADAQPPNGPAARLARALPGALALSLLALVLLWRLRPDLGAALASPALYKTALPLALGVAALRLAPALARPEIAPRTGVAPLALLLAPLLIGPPGLLLYAQTGAGAALRAALETPDLYTCLVSVPALSALPLAGALWSLRAGAPQRPALAGAVAGLAAGGAGLAIYSLHCAHDGLGYVVPAYGTALGLVTLAGAAIGARLLRW